MSESPSISPELAELLARTRPVEEVLRELEKNVVDLDSDPEFVADSLKGQVVEDIYQSMEREGLENKAQLAERLGASRQYVGRAL